MRYEEESGDIRFAFVGDALISRRLSVYREPRFLAVADMLRAADVSFANAETLFHDYEGAPIPDSGPFGTYAACDPAVIDDLRWMGIDIVATANNHAVDYGEVGVLTNIANLKRHGMPFAGTGRTLSEAVAATYVDTPKGSVAMVSVTITLPPGDHRAGEPRGIVKGRPGANVLRHGATHSVPASALDTLREIGRNSSLGLGFRETANGITFQGRHFVAGNGYQTRQEPNAFDLELNLRSIRDARRLADWVVVSVHCHERGATADDPPEVARIFAHACIDAGADVVYGHGPHRERGIELYNGRPILYALGNFVLHNDLIKWEPWDLYTRYGLGPEATTADVYDFRSGNGTRGQAVESIGWRSVVAEVEFEARQLCRIRLHPLDLGFGTPRSQRGRPVLAEGDVAREILERVKAVCAPFGTRVEIDHNQALIAP